MKRKLKIIGTIASLGLCLAMLVVGVYAASTVTFNITGSVSFTVTEVFATVTGKVYQGPSATVMSNEVTANALSGKTYTTTGVLDGLYTEAETPVKITEWDLGDLVYTSTNDCIVYVLEITNDAKSGNLAVTVSELAPDITGTSIANKYKVVASDASVTVAETNLITTAISLAPGSTLTVTVTRTLTEKTAGIIEQDAWSPEVRIVNENSQA